MAQILLINPRGKKAAKAKPKAAKPKTAKKKAAPRAGLAKPRPVAKRNRAIAGTAPGIRKNAVEEGEYLPPTAEAMKRIYDQFTKAHKGTDFILFGDSGSTGKWAYYRGSKIGLRRKIEKLVKGLGPRAWIEVITFEGFRNGKPWGYNGTNSPQEIPESVWFQYLDEYNEKTYGMKR